MNKWKKYVNGNRSYPILYETDELTVYTCVENKNEVFIRLKGSARIFSITSKGVQEIFS